jgi:hypothetical protein
VKKPDTETESDGEMNEQDSAESGSSDKELAADSRTATVAGGAQNERIESADDASWGSDSPQMRSMRARVGTMIQTKR